MGFFGKDIGCKVMRLGEIIKGVSVFWGLGRGWICIVWEVVISKVG